MRAAAVAMVLCLLAWGLGWWAAGALAQARAQQDEQARRALAAETQALAAHAAAARLTRAQAAERAAWSALHETKERHHAQQRTARAALEAAAQRERACLGPDAWRVLDQAHAGLDDAGRLPEATGVGAAGAAPAAPAAGGPGADAALSEGGGSSEYAVAAWALEAMAAHAACRAQVAALADWSDRALASDGAARGSEGER